MASKNKTMEKKDENNEEVLELEDLELDERIERLEFLVDRIEAKLELLGVHTHDKSGRVVVPY